MSEKPELVGEKFGMWTLLKKLPKTKRHHFWLCACACGTTKPVNSGHLTSGRSKCCGCTRMEKMRASVITHGHTCGGIKSKTHETWRAMKERCSNPKFKYFHRYGGRGISICRRWNKFENFLEDMGVRPEGHILDRVNNDGNYCKGNCRWATPKQSMNNMSRNCVLRFKGREQTLTQWCEELGLKYSCIKARLDRGWSAKEALQPGKKVLSKEEYREIGLKAWRRISRKGRRIRFLNSFGKLSWKDRSARALKSWETRRKVYEMRK